MKKIFTHLGNLSVRSSYGIGMTLLVLTSVLLFDHARIVLQANSVSVPLVGSLPDLERREKVLKEQVELSELQKMTAVGSNGEHVDMYVLPEDTNVDRIVATFDMLRDVFSSLDLLSAMSDITIGEREEGEEGTMRRTLTVSLNAHEEGVEQILGFIRLSGLLTVADALSDDELSMLYQVSEQENPAGIIAVEQFLSQSLLRYGRDPRALKDQLLRSFSSPAFQNTLDTITQTSLLRDAERLFSGSIGEGLEEKNLWPIQLLVLEGLDMKEGKAEGWYTLDLTLSLLERD